MRHVLLVTIAYFWFSLSWSVHGQKVFTQADTLRGTLLPERSCFDVVHYSLYVSIYPEQQSIQGFTKVLFTSTRDFTVMQLDLFDNMVLDSVLYHNQPIPFYRKHHAFWITLPSPIQEGKNDSVTIYYQGIPRKAKNPPWDGGFVWRKDALGRHFIGVACEGIGASLWWPCKDHLSDEPDSMMIQVELPDSLYCKSNGQAAGTYQVRGNRKVQSWRVSYPINNYNVTLNIGHYANFQDTYTARDGDTLSLNYYVLDYNIDKAKNQFKQVNPMLGCYEEWFGKYPYWRDGYALVEAPYLGMEHQGAVAYGNKFQNGYMGFDRSGTGWGDSWDYIIIHETGHEYWGNHISAQDHAELWIHESFCTYSEGLYVECMHGKEAGAAYINGLKRNVKLDKAIVGPLGVNGSGSGDMYDKGALMLHTVRHLVGNDSLWQALLRGLHTTFGHRTVGTQEIIHYMASTTKIPSLEAVMKHYLFVVELPVFQYTVQKAKGHVTLKYRWVSPVEGFALPISMLDAKGKRTTLYATQTWQETVLSKAARKEMYFDRTEVYVVEEELSLTDNNKSP
jgi:aminopeptidase N